MERIDILGLGGVAVDDLVFVEAYPPADAKIVVTRRERHCGGLTATALVAAARLGAACAYAGVLGTDPLSDFALAAMGREGIDLRHVQRQAGAQPLYATIIIDPARKTRNVFVDLNHVIGAGLDWPPPEVIQASKVLFVDSIGPAGMLRAARLARAAGIPLVADIEATGPQPTQLIALVDHLILSWEFAREATGAATPELAARAMWGAQRQVVVITNGDQGCWTLTADDMGRVAHQPAFPVAVVDTTGCGDVFHGAYAAGLVRGLGVMERVRLAAAAAALKATRPGGQAGAPTLAEVEQFLNPRAKTGA
jgi:sugar/nucleoside kinase (ribokinase family)